VVELDGILGCFSLVEVIHVELGRGRGTWRMKDEKFECLK
jgi:hypothetical protein